MSSSGAVLTDGCGRLGLDAAEAIRHKLGLDFIPAVFQGRIGSCKGHRRDLESFQESPRYT